MGRIQCFKQIAAGMKQYSINSVEAMKEFFMDVIHVHGCLLHPDDFFTDMEDEKGEAIFQTDVAHYLDQVMTQCFVHCDKYELDVFEIAIGVQLMEYKKFGLLPEDFGTTTGED